MFKQISQGKDSFTFEQFQAVRDREPALLEWMDEPEKFIEQNTNYGQKISSADFRAYHMAVRKHIDSLEDELSKQLGVTRTKNKMFQRMGTGIQKMLGGNDSPFQTLLNSPTVKSNDASQPAANIDKDKFFASFDDLHRKIQTEFKSKTSPQSQTDHKSSKPAAAKGEIGGGGHYVSHDDKNYDMILNVLIGIRRGLDDLNSALPTQLDLYQFEKKLTLESDWITTRSQARSTFKFTEYAPLAF